MRRALVACLVVLHGCSHVSAVRQRAAFELACDEAEVVVAETGGVHDASGCGRAASYACETQKMESLCLSASGVPGAPADAAPPRGVTPRGAALNRAVIDLGCPEAQLQVVALDSRHAFGVKGCGRRVTYVCSTFLWSWGCKADSAINPW